MEVYAETLNHLTQASGGGGILRESKQSLNIRLKPNEVYAVRALDRPDYYRTVMIKRNDLSGKFQTYISNVVPGDPPPEMPEVSSEQVFKQIREMNAGMVVGSDLEAFPFRGHMGAAQQAPGNGLVSQLHQSLQGGSRR